MNKWPVILIAAALTCAPGVEWTRFQGTVKGVNLKSQTLTLLDKSGYFITIPIDYQVKIVQKDAVKRLQDIALDDKVTLIKTPADPQIEDNSGLVPYRGQP